MQTAEVCDKIGKEIGICTVCVVGGLHRSIQKKQLKKGADIVVATPGRLLDLTTEDDLSLNYIEFFVLDEADRMLDMGFEKDIRAIADHLPEKKQTLMFSATWPKSIQSICNQYLVSPIKVTIGKADQLNANRNIKQIVEVIDPKSRDARLRELLKMYHNGKNKVIVFVLYKKEASRIERMLRERGWNVQGLHSDKNQAQRTIAMNSFKCGQCPLLVATDVAARGVDIEDVEYVINYSFPLVMEDYVHRIGRTGRSGKLGTAHTFFTVFDKKHSGALIQLLKEAKQVVPPEILKFGTAIQEKEPKIGKIELNVECNDDHLIFN
ncbi:uncharacterized protein LOC126319855 [Schistocerca gregaria]|uniref:uncharacterized protein LOC126319855 n=1 Tax=Schistocerca gregaria TaxID=7010 RepID=UPI00211DA902|nr:uncharacterized protein LOC126319855 [Schistocerca gregaria]